MTSHNVFKTVPSPNCAWAGDAWLILQHSLKPSLEWYDYIWKTRILTWERSAYTVSSELMFCRPITGQWFILWKHSKSSQMPLLLHIHPVSSEVCDCKLCRMIFCFFLILTLFAKNKISLVLAMQDGCTGEYWPKAVEAQTENSNILAFCTWERNKF